MADFDYIIVGAGTSGCALVGRLAASRPDARIALVESGGNVIENGHVSNPSEWPANQLGPADYAYKTEPQIALDGRWLDYPRGRGLGGSNLINAMIYSRGYREDWDQMPEGWRSADVALVFDSIEQQLNLTTLKLGTFGQAVLAATTHMGFVETSGSCWEEDGVARTTRATVDATTGTRTDIYRSLGADRNNICLIQGIVKYVLTDGNAVIGVELFPPVGRLCIKHGGEVVLCAGAVDTPKLLQLSGLGPADLLQSLNIPVVKNLPIGYNLKDHALLPIGGMTSNEENFSPIGVQGFVNDKANGTQLMIFEGTILPAMIPNVPLAMMNKRGLLRRVLRVIYVRFFRRVLRFLFGLARVRKALLKSVGLNICLMRPTSSGSVMIQSTNPRHPPAIDPNFLSTEEDQKNVLHCVKLAQKIFTAEAVTKVVNQMTQEPKNNAVADYVRDNLGTYYHPTGTCQMGACLDEKLRVHGMTGLRVADASSLPVHPRVPTQAACMLVGARCADFLMENT